ncbi:MAG: hypothetical protein NUK65_03545 [Firmicutes bacterium]|nr:hypothetical protein [Bacillota bacterium]
MITDVITRTGTNVLKVGTALLIVTLAQAALKEANNETMTELAKDIKKVKVAYNDRRQLHAGA